MVERLYLGEAGDRKKTIVGKCKHGLWEPDEKTDLDKKKTAHAAFNIGCA